MMQLVDRQTKESLLIEQAHEVGIPAGWLQKM
jgi:hypothetical protein